MSTANRLPLSRTNMVLVSFLAAGVVICLLLGRWPGVAFLGAIALFVVLAARYARRPDSRDITRINAIEYRDERDRELARHGFAVVGAAALIISTVGAVVAIVVDHQVLVIVSCAQLFALAVIWGIADARAVRVG